MWTVVEKLTDRELGPPLNGRVDSRFKKKKKGVWMRVGPVSSRPGPLNIGGEGREGFENFLGGARGLTTKYSTVHQSTLFQVMERRIEVLSEKGNV